jgi:hypothetical protein
MRRSFAAVLGFGAILVMAACSDQAPRPPLAPDGPSFAQSSQCSGKLAADIAKEQKDLFADPALSDLQAQFATIKSLCPNAVPQFMSYLGSVIAYGGTITPARAQSLVDHWTSVSLYVTNAAIVRPASVLLGSGGAAVLSPGQFMVTNNKGARLEILAGTMPNTPHLFTFEPKTAANCDGTTSLRVTGPNNESLQGNGTACYDLKDYPHETTYSPGAVLTLCLRHTFGETGIVHQRTNFGGEVLPPPAMEPSHSCSDFHASSADSWLKQNGGPLGRVLASAYDYLKPRTLFADDVGESGSIGAFSLVGGVLKDIFADDFNDPEDFNDGVDVPDIGDAWTISAVHPGYVRIQDALGGLSGGVVVISQAQGACNNCPVFGLLGTRVNSAENETIGAYAVTWTSSQTKPNVKEAPFVVLNASNNNNEIARLSYVSQSGQNRLLLKVAGNGNASTTVDVGPWTINTPQTFTLTVSLNGLTPAATKKVSLAINDVPVSGAQNIDAPKAVSLKQFGYLLEGNDAGIIASDNWRVTRLADVPPE